MALRHDSDLALVGTTLARWISDESLLALVTCEIGEAFAKARGVNFSRNDWHEFMAAKREARRAGVGRARTSRHP